MTTQKPPRKNINDPSGMQTIFDGSLDAIILNDAQGRVTKANQAACDSLGYSCDELLNMTVFDFVKDLSKAQFKEAWDAVRNGTIEVHDAIHVRKDGSEYPVESHISVVQVNGEDNILAIVHDMTQLLAHQRSLEYRIAFEELIRAVSTLVNDVRNLCTSLNDVVRILGEFWQIDRCYIFRADKDTQLFSNTHEWCAPGIQGFKHSLQNLDLASDFPWALSQLRAFKSISFRNLNEIPPEAEALKKELNRESICSILFSPIYQNHTLLGFIGFDAVNECIHWDKEGTALLETVAFILAQAFLLEEDYLLLNKYNHELKHEVDTIIKAIVNLCETRDPYTSGHQERVADIARQIATSMGLSEVEIKDIYMGALIHDIGKIQVPSDILTMPRALNSQEYELIKLHPSAGYHIIKEIPFPEIVKQIVLCHHERLDGSGYPAGLCAEKIPLAVRIASVADVFEAMTSHRPYRAKRSNQEAIDELQSNSGKLYDPEVVKHLIQLYT